MGIGVGSRSGGGDGGSATINHRPTTLPSPGHHASSPPPLLPALFPRLSGWLAGLLVVLLLALPAHAADPVTVTLWQLPNREARTVDERADLAVMRRFLELNPHVRLEGFRGVTAPGLSMDSQPLLAMAGGVAPDVMYVNFRQSDSYISQGFLAPLDEYVKRWAGVDDIRKAPKKLKHIILSQMWPVIMRPGPDGQTHVWAIPYGGAVAMTLGYRKDLFRKAGLDPDRPPRNWDELYEYAKRLTVPDLGQYGFGLAAGQSASWHFVDLLWSAAGRPSGRTRRGTGWRPGMTTRRSRRSRSTRNSAGARSPIAPPTSPSAGTWARSACSSRTSMAR